MREYAKQTSAGLVALMLVVSGSSPAAYAQDAEATGPGPLEFFEPFMGPWRAHPDWEPIRDNPELAELVPLNFRWGPAKESIRFCEGLPGAMGEHDVCGLVVWNSTTEQAEFRAFQESGSLVFDAYYEMTGPHTMRRIYDVIRPGGDVDRYRETFELSEPDLIDWRTDRLEDGVWVQRQPQGPSFPGDSSAVGADGQPTGVWTSHRRVEPGSGSHAGALQAMAFRERPHGRICVFRLGFGPTMDRVRRTPEDRGGVASGGIWIDCLGPRETTRELSGAHGLRDFTRRGLVRRGQSHHRTTLYGLRAER